MRLLVHFKIPVLELAGRQFTEHPIEQYADKVQHMLNVSVLPNIIYVLPVMKEELSGEVSDCDIPEGDFHFLALNLKKIT